MSKARKAGIFGSGLSLSGDSPALILAVLAVVIELFGNGARELFRYAREGVLDGEWWRLLTGHVTHLNPGHLALNLAGLALVWLLFRRDYKLHEWIWIIFASVAAMDTGFLWLNPQLHWYVGLSGLLHGLMAAGVLRWIQEGAWEAWALAVGLAAKLVWEQFGGALPFTAEAAGGPVVVDAHLYGTVGGLLAGLWFTLRQRAAACV
ncbi:MAG: rhombosortase [Gammaproteobacteria bacterium]